MNKDILKEIGEYCKKLRKDIGYSQNFCAYCTGVSQAQISRFESGLTDSAILLYWYIKNLQKKED